MKLTYHHQHAFSAAFHTRVPKDFLYDPISFNFDLLLTITLLGNHTTCWRLQLSLTLLAASNCLWICHAFVDFWFQWGLIMVVCIGDPFLVYQHLVVSCFHLKELHDFPPYGPVVVLLRWPVIFPLMGNSAAMLTILILHKFWGWSLQGEFS